MSIKSKENIIFFQHSVSDDGWCEAFIVVRKQDFIDGGTCGITVSSSTKLRPLNDLWFHFKLKTVPMPIPILGHHLLHHVSSQLYVKARSRNRIPLYDNPVQLRLKSALSDVHFLPDTNCSYLHPVPPHNLCPSGCYQVLLLQFIVQDWFTNLGITMTGSLFVYKYICTVPSKDLIFDTQFIRVKIFTEVTIDDVLNLLWYNYQSKKNKNLYWFTFRVFKL